jgi:uroporphyrinogen-III synthase
MKEQIRILSTKKLLPNQKQFLLNAGFSVIEADFIGIRYKVPELKEVNDNLIFTSTNAVKSVLENPEVENIKGKSCFCVGDKTKAVLESNGFTVLESGPNASELAQKIRSGHRDKSFTFFAGNLRLETLPLSLKISGVNFNEIEVYETVLLPHKINANCDGILFFSPSGVESYIRSNWIESHVCFCIGATTAKALEARTNKIVIANKPSVENVIIQTIKYYQE